MTTFPTLTDLLGQTFASFFGEAMRNWMADVGGWLTNQSGGNQGQALVKNSATDGDWGFVDLAPLSDNTPLSGVASGLPGASPEASRSDHQHPPFNYGVVTGTTGGNVALQNLLTVLEAAGAIDNQTT